MSKISHDQTKEFIMKVFYGLLIGIIIGYLVAVFANVFYQSDCKRYVTIGGLANGAVTEVC